MKQVTRLYSRSCLRATSPTTSSARRYPSREGYSGFWLARDELCYDLAMDCLASDCPLMRTWALVSRRPLGRSRSGTIAPNRRPRTGRVRANAACVLSILLSALPLQLSSQETGSISGRVVDVETRVPVADAVVQLRASGAAALSDEQGRYQLSDVPAGPQVVLVEHVAYGQYLHAVVVEDGIELRLNLRLKTTAIPLDPLLVEGRSELEERRQSTGHSMREISREEIDEASRRGLSLTDLLRQGMLGTGVRGGGASGDCVAYRAAASGMICREVAVYVDGVQVSSPSLLFPTMPLSDIERIEMLSAAEAGARYGLSGGWGVLLVETRSGKRQMTAARAAQPAADWSEESKPYPWKRVFTSSLVGSSVGLGLGLIAVNRCLQLKESGLLEVDTRCNGLATYGSSFLALGLPSLVGGFAARWAGATERSRGRLLPAAFMGGLSVVAGYLLVVRAERDASTSSQVAGVVLLTVGTPLLTTVSDRVFRALR